MFDDKELMKQAAKNLGLTILPSGFLYQGKEFQKKHKGMSEDQVQELYNKEYLRLKENSSGGTDEKKIEEIKAKSEDKS